MVRRDGGVGPVGGLGPRGSATARGGGVQLGVERAVLVRPGGRWELELVVGVFVGVYVCVWVFGWPRLAGGV